MQSDKPQTTLKNTERRRDKAWLLSDLRDRRRDNWGRIPRKVGFMQQIAYEADDRFARLIALVKEIRA